MAGALRATIAGSLTVVAVAVAFTRCGPGLDTNDGLCNYPSTNWNLVDDVVGTGTSGDTSGLDLAQAPNGNILAVGNVVALDPGPVDRNHWVVRLSTDGGSTWSQVDDYQHTSAKNSLATSVTVDGDGRFFVGGRGEDAGSLAHWIVRSANSSGTGWSTNVDLAGVYHQAQSLVYVASTRTVHVLGNKDGGGGYEGWAFRQQTTGGGWADGASGSTYRYSPTANTTAKHLIVAANGDLFATGPGIDVGHCTVAHWVVSRSTDAGVTWTVVDDFQYVNASASEPSRIFQARTGAIYVVGLGKGVAPAVTGLIRRSVDGGNSWQTVDAFQVAGGVVTEYQGFLEDQRGKLYVTGHGLTSGSSLSSAQALVRRSSSGDPGSWQTTYSQQYGPGKGTGFRAAMRTLSGDLIALGVTIDGAKQRWLTYKLNCN